MNIVSLLKYTIFAVVFIYTFLWTPINLFLSSLSQKKFPITVVDNDQIRQLVKKKTGIDVVTIKISESRQLASSGIFMVEAVQKIKTS